MAQPEATSTTTTATTTDAYDFVGFLEAVQGGKLGQVVAIVAARPGLLWDKDERGMCGLCWAAYFDEADVAVWLINARAAAIKTRGGILVGSEGTPRNGESVVWGCDKRGGTALHHAAVNGSLRSLRAFGELSTSIEPPWLATNEWGETCLHVAAAAGIPKTHSVVNILLQFAPVLSDAKDKWGRVAFQEHNPNDPATTTQLPDPSSLHPNIKSSLEAEFMKMREQWSERSRKVDILEKGMFKEHQVPNPSASAPPKLAPARRVVLSKIVEYPGDPMVVTRALSQDCDFKGSDMYGLTALHKFSSWDKPDLMQLVLPLLTPEEIHQRGGDSHQTALEMAAEMQAWRAVDLLLSHSSTTPTQIAALLSDVQRRGGDPELSAHLLKSGKQV
ncbi:hypothetical protein Pelo_8066 [Pelomyxa schiedti]|nr:hypothetical protein Pelo_8066 [Pelomyxa schiedti]